MSGRLRLRAEDAGDLGVIASFLQDALVHVGEMTYLPRRRRFAAALNRFMWERNGGKGEPPRRVRCGLHFDGVLAAKTQGVSQSNRDQLLELLTMTFDEGEDGAATVTLVFAGGPRIRLEVECIDCSLVDLGAPWQSLSRPGHGLDDEA